jgi:hypothetical protein
MSRTFIYSFTPPSKDPAPGATIELNVSEIEDAGIREVPRRRAAYGAWSMFQTEATFSKSAQNTLRHPAFFE